MGDGNPAPSRSSQDPLSGGRIVNSSRQEFPEKAPRVFGRVVVFCHAGRKGWERDALGLSTLPECRSLDDLFLMLERDAVDTLVFDDALPEQERRYIVGWARIFKPGLLCETRTEFARRTKLPGCVA